MEFRTLGLAMFLLMAARGASAQICQGFPSFGEGPYQASGGVAFTEGAQTFGGGAALGSDDIFAGASLAFTNVSDADSGVTSFGAHIGASYVVHERERIEACPVGSVIIRSGPDVGPADVHSIGLRAGGRVGVVAVETGNMEVVPTFGLDIAHDKVTAEVGPTETTARDTFVMVRAGVGFILNRRIGLVPSLGVPLGLEGADPEFSFVVSYNFGAR